MRFHILWNLQCLILKLLGRIWCKNSVLMSKLASELRHTNTFYRFTDFKSLFLKINFLPICYDVLNKIAISQERNVRFEIQEQLFRK